MGQRASGRASRDLAWRIIAIALALCFLLATARSLMGNVPPLPDGRALRPLFIAGTKFPAAPAPVLVPVPAGWWATFGALWIFLGDWAQELGQSSGGRAAIWLIVLLMLCCGAWRILSEWQNWRRPSLLFILLVSLQLFGALYYFNSFRAPSDRLQTTLTAFDFHVHTTHSNGLLTPQQQIEWHRDRGFKGLAFTDSNAMMPADELAALRAANPDMMLLNGCEYHGKDAHLIVLGAKTAVSGKELDVPSAITDAKKQGGIVIVAHPWYPGHFSTGQFLNWGADGFEAWNGVIWDRNLAQLDKQRGLVATSATDTLSKSGARCFTWTLLPRGLKDEANVLRALRLHKTAIAIALDDADTPAAYEADQKRGLGKVFGAAGAAWSGLSRAQKWNVLLELAACGAALWLWAMEDPRRRAQSIGPNRAIGFLRRRRMVSRLIGVFLMLLAFAGSAAMARLTMGANFASGAVSKSETLTPLLAILSFIAFDVVFLYGRLLWRRVQ